MSFTLDLSKFAEHGVQNMEVIAHKTFIDLSQAVISDTPVDSGRLRGNWIPKMGEFADNITDVKDKSGTITIQNVRNETVDFKLGDKMTLSNNLPYASRIEYLGYSKIKAPNGMLRLNIIKFQAFVDKNARGLK